MFKTSVITLAFVLAFAAGNVLAGNCNNDNFSGTYTRIDAPFDVFGDGSVVNQHVFTLTLNADGSARQDWTGFLDYAINTGAGTAAIGSWKCRADGKLVVTLLATLYLPVAADPNLGTVQDITLYRHQRITILFNVNNPNKLTRIQSRSRTYLPGADPTNLTGGTLGSLSNTQIVYNRIVASDADLLAP
ncbi:MAG: hypothetical protein PSX80_10445 [bacterium]|nr:hypothetical protein [bacterium]